MKKLKIKNKEYRVIAIHEKCCNYCPNERDIAIITDEEDVYTVSITKSGKPLLNSLKKGAR